MRASRAIKICLGLTMVWALLLAASCGGGSERELLVFTAASLKPALTDLINRYEGDTGENVLISTGGSQLLARQIAAGAPVDVYVPGCPPRPDALLYGIMQLHEKIKRYSIARRTK